MRKKSDKANAFAERTILELISLLKQAVSYDETAARKGFLQRRDPRLKLLAFAVLLAAAICSRSSIVVAALYVFALALAAFSAVGVVFFLKRTLLFVPIFSLFIALPAIFGFVTPGDPVLSFSLFGFQSSVTKQGLGSAGIFFLRVLSCVSLTILLALTTRRHVLLKTLRVFRVPQIFVMITGMTYRYIYLLLDIAQNMFVAVKSRVGSVRSAKTGQNIVGSNMGHLWLQSYRLQTQVYSAMVSRGYTGEPKVLDEFRAGAGDFVFLFLSILVFAGTLWANHCIR